ncbi:glycosyltransferase [Streptomyces sp. NPDC057743]|uniref:glycosyltransferase n=1 Tax=Streptomyces sp. NPDC057743 TaxID=3346236 RepID=UPI0036A54BBA
MRVLATVNASPSHARKFVPLVRALTDAGHEVHFITSAPVVKELAREKVGISTLMPNAYDGLKAMLQGMAAAEAAGVETSTDATDHTEGFNALFAFDFWRELLPPVTEAAREFKPDLLLRDDFDLLGYLAAEQLGVPHVTMSGGSTILLDPARLADPLDAHGAALGVTGSGRGLYGFGRVDYVPAELSFTAHPWPVELRYRQPVLARHGESLPPWIAELPADKPLVYAALGTSLPMQAELQQQGVTLPSSIRPEHEARLIVEALSEVDCVALVASGGIGADLPRAPHVHLVDSVPQPLVLEVADLFLNHGGYNGIREALRSGVPMVVCPQGADQPHNARRIAELGLGLQAADATAEAVARACGAVLGDGAFAHRAAEAKRKVLAMPGVETAPAQLERIASDHA